MFGRKEARGMRDMCGGIWSLFGGQGDDEGGEWEVCRDELEERVLEMMFEGPGFSLAAPGRKATSQESEEASRAACGEW